MTYFGKSDVGKKRDVNQDSWTAMTIGEMLIAIVCDGMGGTSGGSIASSIALDMYIAEMLKVVTAAQSPDQINIPSLISNSVVTANTFLYGIASRDNALRGMGTTLVTAVIYNGVLYAGNVGDSRLYRINRHGITQVTKDHSYVQYLIDIGELEEKDARTSANKNLIMRAIGNEEKVQVDLHTLPILQGEIEYFLLCSDGLSNLIEDKDIYEIIHGYATKRASLEVKVNNLIERANILGGNDNITALLIKVGD